MMAVRARSAYARIIARFAGRDGINIRANDPSLNHIPATARAGFGVAT
jgi:hypothetical protein